LQVAGFAGIGRDAEETAEVSTLEDFTEELSSYRLKTLLKTIEDY
jgi:hypothetical protein